ncbi:hypothetical protein LUZ63_006138 [Rhynchospora breviuscula]|uniref:FLZ-type domain-containing protein n=1 Tax=Rhynchospora breviuscula TaxID=2022672 RepID=A0A9Q0CP80_9POAL|nr:hypothetical protein LUZ63_006138 [Rhynchospora breviuscula]
MVANQSRPSRRAILDPITICERQSSPEPILSPTSPLERNWHTPRGWKKRESDGIGLAIVASLEKSCDRHVSAPISIRGGFELSELGCSGRCTASVCGSRVAGNRDLRLKRDDYQVADFLNCCYLCRKKLHGKDIYMYRGEKAFCSMECRYQQIANDEYQEKCGSGLSKNSEISGSPYTSDRIFFTGIVAA